PQIVPVEIVEQLAEIVIAGRNERSVVRADFGDLFGTAVRRLFVDRPIENAGVPTGRALFLETRRRLKRLVWIEAFEHQKPRIGRAVHVEKLEARRETAGERQVFFLEHELAVD